MIIVLHSRDLAHSKCSKIFVKCENMVNIPSAVVPESLKCTTVVRSLGLQANHCRSSPASLAPAGHLLWALPLHLSISKSLPLSTQVANASSSPG